MKKEWIEPIIETLEVVSTEGNQYSMGNDGVTWSSNDGRTGTFGS